MNISGVLVRAWPAQIAGVRAQLEAQPGVEVHAVSEDGRLVVTVEEESDRLLADRITQFNEITGVLSAAMIYHHHESDQETAQ